MWLTMWSKMSSSPENSLGTGRSWPLGALLEEVKLNVMCQVLKVTMRTVGGEAEASKLCPGR